MAVSQTSVEAQHAKGRVGQIGDSRPRTVESWIAGGDIGFGLAVGRSADDTVTVGATQNTFVGVAVKSPRARPSMDDPTEYQAGTEVSVLTEGVVYVSPLTAVTQGDPVYVDANGRFTDATGSGRALVAGAQWLDTTTAANQIARIRLTAYRRA